jgi:hypothetical protein
MSGEFDQPASQEARSGSHAGLHLVGVTPKQNCHDPQWISQGVVHRAAELRERSPRLTAADSTRQTDQE